MRSTGVGLFLDTGFTTKPTLLTFSHISSLNHGCDNGGLASSWWLPGLWSPCLRRHEANVPRIRQEIIAPCLPPCTEERSHSPWLLSLLVPQLCFEGQYCHEVKRMATVLQGSLSTVTKRQCRGEMSLARNMVWVWILILPSNSWVVYYHLFEKWNKNLFSSLLKG